ncbi:MAG TPA: carboxypeptidase-like regulatory domain-containing protein [Candidatus Binatia bacterium]|nr:carboxypeptidase-like regulatory domain-containing protein [Candidatus Binatia bacterium]
MNRYGKIRGMALLAALCWAGTAAAQARSGRLAGTVVDFSGKPQMGASVWVAAEGPRESSTERVQTNQSGRFLVDRLPVGPYSVRVTLAGFLPVLSRNVLVSANATTVLKLEMDSVFSSVARLRQPGQTPAESDDWAWVLRTSAETSPVLRWQDDGAGAPVESGRRKTPRARVELTSGGAQPGLASGLTPQSAVAYDQSIGSFGRLLLAGQFSYDASGSAGLATTWVPFGTSADSPRTTFAMQQFRMGDDGPMMRALRGEQTGAVHIASRVTIHYSAEYVWLSLRGSTSALRPSADLTMRVTQSWDATVFAGALPLRGQFGAANLESALGQFQMFPAVMFRDGNPLVESGWHEEFRLERKLGKSARFSVAGFHDQTSHDPVFASAMGAAVPSLDYLALPHAVDGGGLAGNGVRAAYRQKFGDNIEAALVYAWAGALAAPADVPDAAALRDALQEHYRHSLALRVGGEVHRTGTRFSVGYKWVNGLELSRQDAYGEVLYDTDPFLNVSLHQSLPSVFGCGRLEAVADLLNVLNEGSTSRSTTADGRLRLTPAPRILRGGLSFQF